LGYFAAVQQGFRLEPARFMGKINGSNFLISIARSDLLLNRVMEFMEMISSLLTKRIRHSPRLPYIIS
jgi:hypothetical protein